MKGNFIFLYGVLLMQSGLSLNWSFYGPEAGKSLEGLHGVGRWRPSRNVSFGTLTSAFDKCTLKISIRPRSGQAWARGAQGSLLKRLGG